MSLTESLSNDENTFVGMFNEHYTLSHAKHVFSRMRDRDPKAYQEKKLSIRQAAELLNVDHKTLHQRIKMLKPKKEKAGRYVKRMLVSVRDLADMIILKPLKACSGKPAKRYSKEETEELKRTGKVTGRTYDSYKVKAHRLGMKLKEIRAHVVCAEPPAGNQGAEPVHLTTAALREGRSAHIAEAATS